jgi:AraC-like DNA-binding protein
MTDALRGRGDMSAPLVALALDIASVVCAVLLGARLLASYPHRRSAQLIALIALCDICYVVLARYEYRFWIPAPFHFEVSAWYGILNFARNLTPGLFMVLCFTLFAAQPRFPRWLLSLFVVQVLLEEPARLLVAPDWRFAHVITQVAPTLLQMMFAGFAIYWAIASWRADLVEERRRTRALTVFVIGLNVIASSLLLRVLIDPDTIANYYAHVAVIAINLAILLFVLFRITQADAGEYLEPTAVAQRSRTPQPNRDPVLAKTLALLKSLLEVERIYKQPGLSLGDLADRLHVPEYRLRKIIREELGFNNYNVFLNGYRIRDACRQLRDPAMRRIPILTIALSVGFQSVNTFNRGFRESLGVTPSVYRSQDSAACANGTEKSLTEN